MDHLPHPFPGQSQTTQHQPHLHRCSRSSSFRPQRRLSRRILRRCIAHRSLPNLRGHLRPSDLRINDVRFNHVRYSLRIEPNRTVSGRLADSSDLYTCAPRTPLIESLKSVKRAGFFQSCVRPLPHPEISATRAPSSQSGPRRTLPLRESDAQEVYDSDLCLQNFILSSLVKFCERPVNFPCGKIIPDPRTNPVIVGDTTCSVSPLTGTISGSNFAIP
jgi:hypothetical protein